jgi:hypothetical protein
MGAAVVVAGITAAIAIEASYRIISAWLEGFIKHIERFIHP